MGNYCCCCFAPCISLCFPKELKKIESDAQNNAPKFDIPVSIKPKDPKPNDMLFALKMASLCGLSYNMSATNDQQEATAAKYLEALEISEFKKWYAPEMLKAEETISGGAVTTTNAKQLNKQHEHLFGGGIAISGVISNLSPDFPKETIFICFRGVFSLSDAIDSELCLLGDEFITKNNKPLGRCGRGFVNHYKALCAITIDGTNMLDYITKTAAFKKCGVVVCGHSLGGGVASLCCAELHLNNPHMPVTLTTFGSPRVFEKRCAARVDKFPYRHMRFVNDDDFITILGDQGLEKLMHTGIPYFMQKGCAEIQVLQSSDPSLASAFPRDPNVIGTIKLLNAFLLDGANKHFLVTPGGYCERLLASPIYLAAVNSLSKPYRQSFDKLPVYYK